MEELLCEYVDCEGDARYRCVDCRFFFCREHVEVVDVEAEDHNYLCGTCEMIRSGELWMNGEQVF